jgi:hypothetical protein
MQVMKSRGMAVLVITAGVAALPPTAPAHSTFMFAQDAFGKIVPHPHLDDDPVLLPESMYPGVFGFAGVEPGLEALQEAHNDLFPLPSTSFIEVMVMGSDPNISLWDITGSGPLPIGGTFPLGAPYFHFHPIWNIDVPGPGGVYEIQLKAHDTKGLVGDSDVFSIYFTPIPEPGTGMLGLLALSALGLRRPRLRIA